MDHAHIHRAETGLQEGLRIDSGNTEFRRRTLYTPRTYRPGIVEIRASPPHCWWSHQSHGVRPSAHYFRQRVQVEWGCLPKQDRVSMVHIRATPLIRDAILCFVLLEDLSQLKHP